MINPLLLSFGVLVLSGCAAEEHDPRAILLPASVPENAISRVREALASGALEPTELSDIVLFDRMLGKQLPPIAGVLAASASPVSVPTGGRDQIVFAVTACPFSLDQIRKLIADGWRSPRASDVWVVISKESWEEVSNSVPDLRQNQDRIILTSGAFPSPLSETRGTPFTLVTDAGTLVAARAGSETADFGFWQETRRPNTP